jgi:hypothetical protein
MGNGERHDMKGTLTLELRDAAGALVEKRVVRNLITDDGRHLVADLFAGKIVGVPQLFIAVGTSNAPPAATDKALAQVARAQASATVAGNVTTVQATLPPAGSGNAVPLTEAGIVIEVGDRKALYNRVIFEVVNKAPNMQLTLSWEVVF